MVAVVLVMYSMEGCLVCGLLESMFKATAEDNFPPKIEFLKCTARVESLNSSDCGGELPKVLYELGTLSGSLPELESYQFVASIKPRLFPTVVAFLDGEPKLGWEGFTSLDPSDLKQSIVYEVWNAASKLSTSDLGDAEFS
jgi:hypothetical protein